MRIQTASRVRGILNTFLLAGAFISLFMLTHHHRRPVPAPPVTAAVPVVDDAPIPIESQQTMGRAKKFMLSRSQSDNLTADVKRIAFMTIVRDQTSWGNGGSFARYINMITSFQYPKTHISLSFLVSDESEFEAMKNLARETFSSEPYRKVTIFLATFEGAPPRAERHWDKYQKTRRRLIARIRNYLLASALTDEDAVLWIDSDMVEIPPDLLGKMVDSGKDIIVPLCQMNHLGDYDLNAWQGKRKVPTEDERKAIARGELFVPGPDGALNTGNLADRFPDEFVPLDSVGGTVLYVRADVHREGAVFPPYYIIGAEWDQMEGYDGIETEGLCYVARTLGYKCWAMPHETVQHSVE
ncbi:Anp1-domain-containing protein [Powellomyces hirtus]|nr:Anp1-domain-containing protein [Powellomyces hirtus]